MSKSRFHRLLMVVAELTTTALFLASILAPSAAVSDEANARLLRKMFTAFQCSSYASFAEKKEEAQRLFDAGIKAGREALKAGNISQEILMANGLPFTVLKPTNPSADVFIGRVYSNAHQSIFEDLKEYDLDEVIPRCERAYRLSNCEAID